MLGLAEKRRLGAAQDQRKAHRQVGSRYRADLWLLKLRQRRVALVEKGLRVKLNLARRRRKAARRAVRVRFGIFRVAGLQRELYPAAVGAQLLKADASRRQLMAVGGVDVAVPELCAEPEPPGEIKDDVGIGACLAGWRHDGW